MRNLFAAVFLLPSLTCLAQFNPTYSIQVQPLDPQPNEAIDVFIRGTDPSGLVSCPAASRRITDVTISGRSILVHLSNQGSLGGVPMPYCDGNMVRIGPLDSGGYDVRASVVLTSGAVMPALATAHLTVAPLEYGRNFTALWGVASEVGWGLNVAHQGNVVFATLFTYDAAGSPLWLVMPAGMRQTVANTFSGDIYRTTGSPYNAEPFLPLTPSNVTRVGSMSLSYSSPNEGVLTYDVDGRTVTKAIRKEVFGMRPAACAYSQQSRDLLANYQDLWWNPSESGWGLNITQQDDIIFGTLFTYGSNNRPLWLVMPEGRRQAGGDYFGNLYETRGPTFDAQPWTNIEILPVGTMRLLFDDGDSGTLEYTINGSTVAKRITRQVFGSLLPSCS